MARQASHPRGGRRFARLTDDIAPAAGHPARMRTRILLPLAATFALACAGVASADSLVYIKDGNVWLSSPDASKAYQVTFDGGYSSPSQSDNGTIAALRGGQLVRMDRTGRQLNAPIDGMGSPGANNGTFYGPYEPRISPDGSKIA
jgi:hypothetical protein